MTTFYTQLEELNKDEKQVSEIHKEISDNIASMRTKAATVTANKITILDYLKVGAESKEDCRIQV